MDHLNGRMIARSNAFGREAYKVLWYLTEKLTFDAYATIHVDEISADLGMKSQAVSRAVRTLILGGVLERGPKVGQRGSFRFCRTVAQYGAPSPQPSNFLSTGA